MQGTQGFSIIEIVIVLVILGIMAGLSLGSRGGRGLEYQRMLRAQDNLRVIYNAQKRFKLDSEDGQYFPPKVSGLCLAAEISKINGTDNLGLFIRDAEFNYSITGVCSSGVTTGYTAIATRISGPCVSQTITLTHNGGEPVVSAACSQWQ